MSNKVRPLLGEYAGDGNEQILADELWALLHGMSALYMDRVAPFDLATVTNAVLTLIQGGRMRQGARLEVGQ
jgi:hypothetical protein